MKNSLSSSAVKSRISRGGGGGGLKHTMLTVHPLMFRVGAVCGSLGDTVTVYLATSEQLIHRTM